MFVQIGIRQRVAEHAAKTLPAVELLLAIAIVTAPSLLPTVVLTSIAGLTIVTVGVLALRRPYEIRCVCFSSDNGRSLGWRQVAVGLAILLLAVGSYATKVDSLTLNERFVVFGGLLVGCVLVHVASVFPIYRRLARARTATTEAFPA